MLVEINKTTFARDITFYSRLNIKLTEVQRARSERTQHLPAAVFRPQQRPWMNRRNDLEQIKFITSNYHQI